MTPIKKDFLCVGHRCRSQRIFDKTSITIHSTGNANSTAKGERAWLDNPTNKRYASWHYVIDATTIIQAIPETEEAWHCGNDDGNRCSIGVEICESGDRRKTLENAAEFVAGKLKAYGWGTDRIKKHYDWSGKNCPRILIDKSCVVGGMDWNWFIGRVEHYLKGEEEMVEKRYNTLAEVPEWGRKAVERLIAKGKIANVNKLDLTYDMVRMICFKDE